MRRCQRNVVLAWLLIGLMLGSVGSVAELKTRIKYSGSNLKLPTSDFQREFIGNSLVDHQLDARFQFSGTSGSLSWNFDTTVSWLQGDRLTLENLFSTSPADQIGSQERYLVNLADRLAEDEDSALIAGIDRAVLQYRRESWSVRIGRDAVSWGNGIVFQPLDLFNPFSPTTVDREFKSSSDSILFDRLFGNGSDLQVLYIGRRTDDSKIYLDDTLAVKYSGFLDQYEYELVAAFHYDDLVLGGTLKVPLGGALLRTDLVQTCDTLRCFESAVINVDYAFSFKGTPMYAFVEGYHNGFGVTRLGRVERDLPKHLRRHQARGEVFNLMQNYLATGFLLPWHPLVNQTFTWIQNLHDGGALFQTFATFDPTDNVRLQMGFMAPIADAGDEYGELSLEGGKTTGGGKQAFLILSYYL